MAESESPTTVTIGDLKKIIDDRLSAVIKTGTNPSGEDPKDKPKSAGSIEEQVARSLERIRAKEEADNKEKTLNEKITELEKRTAEKPPVERSRIHKIMGWGE